MTGPMLIVFGILAGAIALFASGRLRPDVVAILVVLALNLSGVLTIQEALAGFGEPVVALIAAVSIVGEGLIATGVAYRLGEAVMKAGGSSEARLVALVMVLAGTVGAFMSSSAIVAMFIPVVLAIADKTGLNRKRMLMPALGSSAGQRHDDLNRVVAKHDRRRHSPSARPRPAQLLQLDALRCRRARHRHPLYAGGRSQYAEQTDVCRRGWGEATECLRPARILWPCG